MPDRLMTAASAARLKGVTRSAIYAAVKQGRLRHQVVLGKMGLWESEVVAWVPVAYAGRPGSKGRGGRPQGLRMTRQSKVQLSVSQKQRWARRKAQSTTGVGEPLPHSVLPLAEQNHARS